jgi:hypothetical protein
VVVPPQRLIQARLAAAALGEDVFSKFPWPAGTRPVASDLVELVLNRTWRPALAVTGVDGIPPLQSAGNVLRPQTTVKLSMRIPPRLDPVAAQRALKAALEKDPPYGAKVSFEADKASTGWDAPVLAPWLDNAVDAASRTYFGKPEAHVLRRGRDRRAREPLAASRRHGRDRRRRDHDRGDVADEETAYRSGSSASCALPMAIRSVRSSRLSATITFSEWTAWTASRGTTKSPAFSTLTTSSGLPPGATSRTAPNSSAPSWVKTWKPISIGGSFLWAISTA